MVCFVPLAAFGEKLRIARRQCNGLVEVRESIIRSIEIDQRESFQEIGKAPVRVEDDGTLFAAAVSPE
jgi:hypothetical protein